MQLTNGKKLRILVTGGAGFIGSHLVDDLIDLGHNVTIIDKLDPEVHPNGQKPYYLNTDATFIKADIRNYNVLKSAIIDNDVIFHLVASNAVGQSTHQIAHYVSNNIQATAILWDLLANTSHSIKKVILASSRAVYGEGPYHCEQCDKEFVATARKENDLKKGIWEIRCPTCSGWATPLLAQEEMYASPASVYGITKNTQEEISICCAKAINLPVVVLRFSNVYGARQSMSNPYVGISSIFAANAINGIPIEIYEDGLESRDFVYVKDVVQACILAMQSNKADNEVFNVGSGQIVSILELAHTIIKKLNSNIKPNIVGKYRIGDIRHLHMDISKIKRVLGFEPFYSFSKGANFFINWVQSEKPADFYKCRRFSESCSL